MAGQLPATTAKGVGLLSALPLIGSVVSAFGQMSANRANRQMAREQMRFQERMSSTAYQRAAKDLEAAGLNRILALGKPSSTPSGQTAQMQNIGKDVIPAINSAISLRMQNVQILNVEAQTALTNAQRQAIQPAATIGGIIEAVTDDVKEHFKGKTAMQVGKEAKLAIGEIAKSLGLSPEKTNTLLMETLNKMDEIPSHWTPDKH